MPPSVPPSVPPTGFPSLPSQSFSPGGILNSFPSKITVSKTLTLRLNKHPTHHLLLAGCHAEHLPMFRLLPELHTLTSVLSYRWGT